MPTRKLYQYKTGIVKYRIGLPPTDVLSSITEYENGLKTYPLIAATYRFILEYMEGKDEDIPKLRKLIYSCLPIDKHKETPYWSALICLRMFDPTFKTINQPLSFLSQLSLTPIFWPFRVLANLTCKRPIWSDEIEHLCRIEKDDPNEIDGSKNPKGFKLFRYAVGYLTLKEYSQLIHNIDEASQLNIPSSNSQNIRKNN
ncbi:hypothetical protein [Thorsellia anophelis]|uniref:Uncharacterized protein n=1 Tax=Thorsellia anophelis DSM 18579 TaxID=1123402 RepID=A0A1I0EE26_9GAMM|nr:hypothetical protein [Thorsellia anophelis]SET43499.1 hypothetical protein SAMN02583745_02355 [Thorsellia anophelis DSM 18579]